MSQLDERQLYRVTAGPYKNLIGFKVNGAQVRGDYRYVYIESEHTGDVYEITNPKHVVAFDRQED